MKSRFDSVVHVLEDISQVEYWLARELQELLGYARWENFDEAIRRAMASCETSGVDVLDHFRGVTKTIDMPKNATRDIPDYMLAR